MKIATPLVQIVLAGLAGLGPACTVVHVDSQGGPPRIESRGVVDGHAALGIRDEARLLDLHLFDGRSPGAVGELVLWKLFRLEVGLAGLAVGLGPLDLGLGVLSYDPRLPSFEGRRESPAPPPGDEDDDV